MLKEEGNSLFKNNFLKAALEKYEEALQIDGITYLFNDIVKAIRTNKSLMIHMLIEKGEIENSKENWKEVQMQCSIVIKNFNLTKEKLRRPFYLRCIANKNLKE